MSSLLSSPPLAPTPVKISTITATGSVGGKVDLDRLYQLAEVTQHDDEEGFVYIESGQRHGVMLVKGFHRKLTAGRKSASASAAAPAPARRFDNQTTLVLRMRDPALGLVSVNMKVFGNGNVQMTGLKSIEQGPAAIAFLIARLPAGVMEQGVAPQVKDYKVCLINCDFRLGCEVRRDRLCEVVQQHRPGVFCNFEPCIYPGVKVQYNCNEAAAALAKRTQRQDGACTCTAKCNGKGSGSGDGQCKKTTISVFQSGCVIITGGQSMGQVRAAYDFICTVVQQHLPAVQKVARPPPAPQQKLQQRAPC